MVADVTTGTDIYTACGPMLIAVNPCAPLEGLYGAERMRGYLDGDEHEPHVYRTAARVYHGVSQGRCQSIVISGESGAGKTENFKHVIEYVSESITMSRRAARARSIEKALLETGEALEP